MATVDTGYQTGVESLRSGLGMLSMNGDVDEVKAFLKAASGDFVIKCTPATVAKTATSEAWTQDVVVTLETNDGELHKWYNGNITLAVADTGTGTAAIDPAAGAHAMTNGSLTVTLSGDAGSSYWANTQTATLTASVTSNNPGLVQGSLIANATCVVTFST